MYQLLQPGRDERMRRQWAAAEARGLGRCGLSRVARATGLSKVTINAGLAELELSADERDRQERRIRRPGGRQHPLIEVDPQLLAAHEQVEQNRAPAVQLHYPELARTATDGSGNDHPTDRIDQDRQRAGGRRRTRHRSVPNQDQSEQRGTSSSSANPTPLPRGVESCYQAQKVKVSIVQIIFGQALTIQGCCAPDEMPLPGYLFTLHYLSLVPKSPLYPSACPL